jgi:hypothetical protein
MILSPFETFVMAVERVQQRLRKVTSALNEAKIPYAVVGGKSVAIWVARADPSATRTTVDVDLLIDPANIGDVSAAMSRLGFERHLRRLVLFTDPEEPSRRSGVHLVWAGRKLLPSYAHPAPSVKEAVFESTQRFWVLDLPALVRMKLTSYRDIDRVHIADLLKVGLIDEVVRSSLPADLRQRLKQLEERAADDGLTIE